MLAAGVKEGAVVNVSSLAAKSGSRDLVSYVASKAGILGLTKCTALDVAGTGIRCNAVLPGFTETPRSDLLPEDLKTLLTAKIPLGRPSPTTRDCERSVIPVQPAKFVHDRLCCRCRWRCSASINSPLTYRLLLSSMHHRLFS
ncbi:hypothetical protein MTO96_019133 [Rhipicephalus appendiculatus]